MAKRIALVVAVAALLGLGVALLPGPTAGSAATPTVAGSNAKVTLTHNPTSTYFSGSCPDVSTSTTSGSIGTVHVTVTQIPSGTDQVVLTYGDSATQTLTLTAASSPAWEGDVPTTFQCRALASKTNGPNTTYSLPWTAQAKSGTTNVGQSNSGSLSITSFD